MIWFQSDLYRKWCERGLQDFFWGIWSLANTSSGAFLLLKEDDCQRAFALCCKVIAFSWKEKKENNKPIWSLSIYDAVFFLLLLLFLKGDMNSLSLHRPLDSVWFSLSQTRPFKARQRWISSRNRRFFSFFPTLIDTFHHDRRSLKCTTWMADESSVDENKCEIIFFGNIFLIT